MCRGPWSAPQGWVDAMRLARCTPRDHRTKSGFVAELRGDDRADQRMDLLS